MIQFELFNINDSYICDITQNFMQILFETSVKLLNSREAQYYEFAPITLNIKTDLDRVTG